MKHYFLILLASFALVFAGCDKNPSPTYYGGSGGSGTDGGGSDSGSANAIVDVSMLTQLRINMMDDTIEKCWHWVITNGSQTKEGYIWTTEKAIATELFQAYNHYLDEGVTVKCTYTPTSATDVDGCKAPDSGGGSGGDNPGGGDDPVNPGGGDGDGGGNGDGDGGSATAMINNNFKAMPFTVDNDGRTIVFSQGNLQYHAVSKTWRFAGQQWEFVGDNAEGNVYENGVKSTNRDIAKSEYSGWIDLFGWGTSGWNSGAVEYQPMAYSATAEDYYPGGDPYNNLTGNYAEADWGVHNSILNGGNKKGMWRTLTTDEWAYILYYRDGGAALVSSASIDGVKGIVILPDNGFNVPAGLEFMSFAAKSDINWNESMHAYEAKSDIHDVNQYTVDEWAMMEAAGAVFLPCCGRRKYVNMDGANWLACYWSSTACENYEGNARSIGCQGSGFYIYASNSRSYAYSVRLVRDN